MSLIGKTRALAILCSVAVTPVVLAQQVTLLEAAELMRGRDFEYRIIELEADIAAERIAQADVLRYPRVSVSFDYTQTRQEIISQDNEVFEAGTSEFPTLTLALTATQPIYDRVGWRARPLAEAEAAVTLAQSEVTLNELKYSLSRTYLAVAREQSALRRAEILLKARADFVGMVQRQVDAGRSDNDTLLRAQTDMYAAEAELTNTRTRLSDALYELYRFTGSDVDAVVARGVSPFNLNSFLDELSIEKLLELSPVLEVARAELAVAWANLDRARAAFHPTAYANLDFGQENTQGSLFGGGSEVRTLEFGVTLSQSIFGGARGSLEREADRRIELARVRKDQLSDILSRRYQAITAALVQADARRQSIENQVVLTERTLRSAERLRSAGRVGMEFVMEQELRLALVRADADLNNIRTLELQLEVLSMFGALNIDDLSKHLEGEI